MKRDLFELEQAYASALADLQDATLALALRLSRSPADDAEGDSSAEELSAYLADNDEERADELARFAGEIARRRSELPRLDLLRVRFV